MRAAVALFATAVLSLSLTVEYPDVMIKPGALSEGHRALGRDCMRCHVAGGGARSDRCAACHTTDGWSPATFDHVRVTASGASCASCHQSRMPADDLHRGAGGEGTVTEGAASGRMMSTEPAGG